MADPRPTPRPSIFGRRGPGPRFRCAIRCAHRKGAPMADPRPTPRPSIFGRLGPLAARRDHPAGSCRDRPPRALKGRVGRLGIPPGLTPPVSERAPPPGPDQAPPRRRDGGRREARATPPWSRSATPQCAVDPELAPPPEPGRFPCQLEGPNDCTASTDDR